MYIYTSLGIIISLLSIFGLVNKRSLVDKMIFLQIGFAGLVILLSSISVIQQNEIIETFIYTVICIFSLSSLIGIGLLFHFIKNGKSLSNISLDISEE